MSYRESGYSDTFNSKSTACTGAGLAVGYCLSIKLNFFQTLAIKYAGPCT